MSVMRRTRRLGRYHLTERIAYGGMAEIFRGFTFGIDDVRYDVAIKRLLTRYSEDQNFVTMLRDEFKMVSRISDENVAKVYELVNIGNELLVSMEFVDGKDLRSIIDRGNERDAPLSVYESCFIMAQSLRGLHAAHEAKDVRGESLRLVHRDFTPSNMLVDYDGTVKVCDFGIAKATLSSIKTRAGIIKGKVKYMSPEQAFGHKLDRRSDVFSAGSVLYELVTGEPAFRGASEMDLIFTVREARPIAVRERRPSVPQALADIIDRSMTRSRTARYPSALAFHDELMEFLDKHGPGHIRRRLARHLKELFATEIDKELRALEDYVLDLDEMDEEDFGTNLIAGELGPDAPFAHFTPSPTMTRRLSDLASPTVRHVLEEFRGPSQ